MLVELFYFPGENAPLVDTLHYRTITFFLRGRIVAFSFFVNLVDFLALLFQTLLKPVAPGLESIDHLRLDLLQTNTVISY